MKLFSLVIVLNALVMLTSCSSDGEQRPEYLDSQSVKQLEVPPELTRLNDNEELYIPKPSSKALLA